VKVQQSKFMPLPDDIKQYCIMKRKSVLLIMDWYN